MNCSQTEAG